jgi:hypothetical protein
MNPALAQRLAVKQQAFRDKKRGFARPGHFPARHDGNRQVNFIHIPGEFRQKRHAGKQNKKEEKAYFTQPFQRDHL